MKKQVKNFTQFVNEARFHHRLPNNTQSGGPRLRDEFRALPQEEKAEIEELALRLNDAGLLDDVTRTLSRFNNIEELKAIMMDRIAQLNAPKEEPKWSIRGMY